MMKRILFGLSIIISIPLFAAYLYMTTPVKGAHVWTPLSLPSLVSWADCSNSAQVTLSGSNVTNVASYVNGYNFAQGTAANQPTISSAGLSGKDACSFDGTNDYLTATTGSNLTEFSLWVVARPLTTLAQFKQLVGTIAVIGNNTITLEEGAGADRLDLWFSAVSAKASTGAGTFVASTTYRILVTYSQSTPAGVVYINNVSLGTTNQGSGFLDVTPQAIGYDGGAGFGAFKGLMAEWGTTGAVLSTSDRNSLDTYLAAKYP